jgi:DNA-binding transcriptional LysR family regulator
VIDYRFAPNTDIEQALSKHEIDIGFMTTISDDETVSCKPVAQEALQLVTPVSTIEPSWEALTELGFIDHPDGAHHASLLLSANYPKFEHINGFNKKGFSNQIGMILEPVSRGLGFTVLPAHAVAAYPNPQLLKSHQLLVSVSETLYLAIRRQQVLPTRMQTVINEVKKWL